MYSAYNVYSASVIHPEGQGTSCLHPHTPPQKVLDSMCRYGKNAERKSCSHDEADQQMKKVNKLILAVRDDVNFCKGVGC